MEDQNYTKPIAPKLRLYIYDLLGDVVSEAKIRILETAADMFMELGYGNVKLKELADRLDMKPPSLYFHFPDGKEQIYVEAVEHTLNQLNQELLDIISSHLPNLRTTLIEIGRWAENNMTMSPVTMFRVDMPQLSQTNRQKLGMSAAVKLFGPIREMFAVVQQEGQIRDVSVEVVTGIFLSMLEGMDSRINFRVPDKMVTWTRSIDVLLHGILSSPHINKTE